MKEMTVDEVRRVQLAVLKAVDSWCRENGVRYFLIDGTLLGAVRHKGYIPWDDDIDIAMLRPDYDRFLRGFNANRTDAMRVLHHSIAPDFPYGFAKIHDSSTSLVENIGVTYEIGVNIDLFALDSVGDSPENAVKAAQKLKKPFRILEWKHMLGNDKASRPFVKRVGVSVCKAIANRKPMAACTAEIDRIAQAYKGQKTDWVAELTFHYFDPKVVFKSEWFEKTIELDFEGNKFCAPERYDEILTASYGDYMQPPPKAEQITHHNYKAYQL